MTSYEDFVASKFRLAPESGVDVGDGDLLPSLFPHQRDLVRWSLRKGRAAIFADTGLGKAQPVDELVLTPAGWREIGSIRVGDSVIGASGRPIHVTAVYPQGVRSVSRLVFSDGAECRADDEHLWAVQTDLDASRGNPWRTMTTAAIRADLRAPDGRARWRVPLVTVDGDDIELPIDPYVLGVLLGDGCLTGTMGPPCFTSADAGIVEEIQRRLPPGFRCAPMHRSGDRTQSYALMRPAGAGVGSSPSVVKEALRGLGLWEVDCFSKFIPQRYMRASTRQRADLLRGLMDSDGWTGCSTQFTSSNERLALDVCDLARSLGGTARVTSRLPTYTYQGERRTGATAYAVTIKVPFVPFALGRKVAAYEARPRTAPTRKVLDVGDAGEVECVCIRVDALDHLYVTRDYVVTHNTLMELEWARHVSVRGRVIILCPLAVAQQTIAEAARFGVDATYLRADDGSSPIVVTNYEMLDRFDAAKFAGVVLDESSILKAYDGSTRTQIIRAFEATPFKLAATATPAPNDFTELGNHAEFLGVRSRAEMLAEFFVHDGGSTQDWRLKGHAVRAFWRWVASWGAVIRSPVDLGHDGSAYVLPDLRMHEHVIESDAETARAAGVLFATDARTLHEQRAVRRGSIDLRVEIASRITRDVDSAIVWCELNDESSALAAAIDGAVEVRGSDTPESKADALTRFARGEIRVLVTKSSIAGFGMNFQRCACIVFAGVSHSYEQTYQAIRRCWRFGQTRPVDVHVIRMDVERFIVENYRRKEADAARLAQEMSVQVRDQVRAEVQGRTSREWNAYEPRVAMIVPNWIGVESP